MLYHINQIQQILRIYLIINWKCQKDRKKLNYCILKKYFSSLEKGKRRTGVFFYIKEMSRINEESKQIKVVDALRSRYVNRHKIK